MKIYFIIAWAFISTVAATFMYVERNYESADLNKKLLQNEILMSESVVSLEKCQDDLRRSIGVKELLFGLGSELEGMFKELASVISRYDQLVRSSCNVKDMATFAAAYRSVQEDYERVMKSYEDSVKDINQ